MEHHPQAWMSGSRRPIFKDRSFTSKALHEKFNMRAKLLEASVFKSPCFKTVNGLVIGARYKATIVLSEFADWCKSVELDTPPELLALARIEENITDEPNCQNDENDPDRKIPPNTQTSKIESSELTKRAKQVEAILMGIENFNLTPMQIPTGEKSKIRKWCKESYPTLFGAGDDPFKEAWQVGLNERKFRLKDHDKFTG
jgi:hypothetical protein